MLSKQIQILISSISVSLWDREARDGKERKWKKPEGHKKKFLASNQCERTFYQLSDKGLSRRTRLNFCCQTVLWFKTIPIKEERSRTYSFWKLNLYADIHFWIWFCSSGLLAGFDDPKSLCQPKWLRECWVLVFWYHKLPNEQMVALGDWWEKRSVIALKH